MSVDDVRTTLLLRASEVDPGDGCEDCGAVHGLADLYLVVYQLGLRDRVLCYDCAQAAGHSPAPGRVRRALALIEEARSVGELGNDQARAASVALRLSGDEAMLACRVVAQGADPASLDYLDVGEVSGGIAAAHRSGPSVFDVNDPALVDYLALCALSADEAAKGTVRSRVLGFARAVAVLALDNREPLLEAMGRAEREKIRALKYREAEVAGVWMRVYTTDRGFAAASWDGCPLAAVLGDHEVSGPYVAVGAPHWAPDLEDQGVRGLRWLSPKFGILDAAEAVAKVRGEFERAVP